MEREKILQALEYLDPASLDYNDWLRVGMALKFECFNCQVWDDWSKRDPSRYDGKCKDKWNTFKRSSGNTVSGGTIIQLAQDHGWKPENTSNYKVKTHASSNKPQTKETTDTTKYNWQTADLTKYLEVLFKANEYVGYVTTDCYQNGERWSPKKGEYTHTTEELLEKLRQYPDNIYAAIGNLNYDAGAWIRINPLDGKGASDKNVTDFRHALVESDEMPVAQQEQKLRELNLPIAALVSSGGKSIHAVVRINAQDREQYNERVAFLFKYLNENGFPVDRQNKNPSRLSRMPGVMRGEQKQKLLGVNIGTENWDAWCESLKQEEQQQIEFINASELDKMELPPIRCIVTDLIVEGLNIIASPPKFGKSWLCIDLGLSVATGTDFLGFHTEQCGVLYLALEDGRSRLQSRARKIAGDRTIPNNFYYAFEAPPLDHGLLDQLEKFVQEHSDVGLIIIDTFQLIRSGSKRNESAYSADYRETHQLKQFADSHHIAILLVHHLRKMIDPSDAFANVSGTTGITGAADTSIILTREKRTDENTTLSITGRDISMQELSAKFDKESCRWSILGEKDILEQAYHRARYEQNPVVQTIKALLDQNNGCWQGTINEIIKASKYLTDPIFDTAQKVGRDLPQLAKDMFQYDSIIHEELSHGNAGKKHRFYYQQDEDNPFTENDDFIEGEFTDAEQIALPLEEKIIG